MTEEETEEKIVILNELVEKIEGNKDMFNMALRCANCNHRDLLDKFLVENKRDRIIMGAIQPKKFGITQANPFRATPTGMSGVGTRDLKTSRYRTPKYESVGIWGREYLNNFTCPKCNSSLIVLDKEFTKNNVSINL